MKIKQNRQIAALAALASMLVATNAAYAQTSSTGADGAFAPQTSTQVQLPASGIFNYTTVTIPAGVTVTYKPNATNTPVYMLATGAVSIAGVINIAGANSVDTGTAGAGSLGTDGTPGIGGPGGYAGGRGGAADPTNTAANQVSGAGLGPGGAPAMTAPGNSGVPNYGSYSTLGMNQFQNPPGALYGSSALQPLIGGSGGSGGFGGTNFSGGGGGGGGGAMMIYSASSISLTGSINANGGSGGAVGGAGVGNNGGGASGGAVRLVAPTITGAGTITAVGGCSNGAGENCTAPIYNVYALGGSGFIRLEASSLTYTGTTTPVYSAATSPQALFISSAPSLTITSVNSIAVPASPTGNADVTLPSTTTGSVPIVFTTANVPVGNTVTLTISPAYGVATTAISGALSGTTASATASTNVILPPGPSTLIATTTYTIVVAMGDALSQYADNERVEKIQLVAGLGDSESTVKLITVSGRQFIVPASLLQTVAFSG